MAKVSSYLSSFLSAPAEYPCRQPGSTGPRYSIIARIVAFITDNAGGSYLYANHVLDLIAGGHLAVRSGILSGLPRNLAEVYHLHCELSFPTPESFHMFGRVLSICLAAVQPLLLKELPSFLRRRRCRDGGATRTDAADLATMSGDFRKVWLLMRIKREKVEFRHSSVRDWLQDPGHR